LHGPANRIQDVTVFTSQAYVKRGVRASARPGVNRICVEVQAHEVDADSCQATVHGKGEILGVQYREVPVGKAPQADLRALDEEIDRLKRRRQPLLDEQKILDTQTRFLDSVNLLAESEMPKRMRTRFPDADDLTAMVRFLGDEHERILSRARELDEQLSESHKQLGALEQRRKDSAAPDRQRRKVVEILFRTEQQQELDIEAGYVAGRARWEPVYKIDVERDLSGLALTLFAKIRQSTGENWHDVSLSVSNVAPMAGGELPDLVSWYVQPYRSAPARAAVTMARELRRGITLDEAAVRDWMPEVAEAAAAPEAEFAGAAAEELPNAFEYELPERVRIDSGSAETLFPLLTRAPKGEFYHYTVPKAVPVAFLVCRVEPDSEMMAGTLNVHMGGRFIGSTTLTEKRPGEPLRINLGPDRGIKLRREKPSDKTREKLLGVERSKITRDCEYRIVVENLKDQPVTLELLEAMPIARSDVYKIKDVELTPDPAETDYDDREGVMRWLLDLAPGETKELRTRFTLTYPRRQPPQL
jgi:uncharacterized protein (TIGR02231 family)